MNTVKKLIIILLVFHAIGGTYFEIKGFLIPNWIKNFDLPDTYDLIQLTPKILMALSYFMTFTGVIKLINLKKIEIIDIFKYPIYYFFISNIFWLITTSLSTKHSFIFLPLGVPKYYYIFKFHIVILMVLIVVNYLGTKNEGNNIVSTIEVKKTSRLYNWILDLLIIACFYSQNRIHLSQGSIFQSIPFLNSNYYCFFLLNYICYYLLMEFLFLQTIGKLHNNSKVTYNGNRLKSILVRTLCRLIPFEAFSFLGKKGWHDSISKTKVTIANNV